MFEIKAHKPFTVIKMAMQSFSNLPQQEQRRGTGQQEHGSFSSVAKSPFHPAVYSTAPRLTGRKVKVDEPCSMYTRQARDIILTHTL